MEVVFWTHALKMEEDYIVSAYHKRTKSPSKFSTGTFVSDLYHKIAIEDLVHNFSITTLNCKVMESRSVPRKFLGIVGQDPSDSKSSRLHVDIFQFWFMHSRYILQIPLKWYVILLKSRTSTGYFSNSTGSSVTNRQFSLDSGLGDSQHFHHSTFAWFMFHDCGIEFDEFKLLTVGRLD